MLREVQKHTISGNDLVKAMMTIAQQAEINMGGTSGALYWYSAFSRGLRTYRLTLLQQHILLLTCSGTGCESSLGG